MQISSHMPSRRNRTSLLCLLIGVLCLSGLLLGLPLIRTAASFNSSFATPQEEIRTAWERLQDAGVYSVAAEVEQISHPLATIQNVGKQTERSYLHMDGTVNRFEKTMEMDLWSQGGSVLDTTSSAQIKMEGERAYARSGEGDWQEIQNFTGMFAPGGDFSIFLSSVKNARFVASGTPADESAGLTRYAFEVDGYSLANKLQTEIQKQMTAEGLPPGVEIALSGSYQDMTGSGEVWINADGYPVRQKITLAFPPQEDSTIEALLDVSFSGVDGAPLAGPHAGEPVSLFATLSRWYTRGGKAQLTTAASTLALLVLTVLLFLKWSRSRAFQNALALTVILSLVISPLLKSVRAADFFTERQARAEELASANQSEMQKVLEDIQQEGKGLPAQVALQAIAADDGDDSDDDGLTDLQEAVIGTSPFEFDSTGMGVSDLQAMQALGVAEPRLLGTETGADSDGDGLTDYQENLLGTSSEPADANGDGLLDGVDSDMDGVSDFDEVNGFEYNGKRWYTDPLEPDTNQDGLPDGSEWFVEGSPHATWDLDQDGTPDAFDLDNDGDGVMDQLDLSPYIAPENTFTRQDPFSLSASGLTPGKITYTEFQFRPTNLDHLRYAYNVLDWPYDTEGQVKDLDNATFYGVNPGLPAYPNNNGDMKLVPMLEIQTGSSVSNLPLTAAAPEVSVTLQDRTGSGISGSVKINQIGSDLEFQYASLSGEPLAHAIYRGTCAEPAARVAVLSVDAQNRAVLPNKALETLVNGKHVLLAYPASGSLGDGYGCGVLPNLPRESGKWVDLPLLNKYGISVVPQANGSKTVYVPVELTTVTKTSEKVAFHAKMIYQPQSADWGTAHSVRLMWMVQALVDHCAGPDLSSCSLLNNPEIIQTYYTDFQLTGLAVRENRGFDTAVIYEDPALDNNLRYDDSLFMLSHILESTFLAAYDCDSVVTGSDGVDKCQGNGALDFNLQRLRQRFDHQSNAGVTDEERFELPNTLAVRTFTYDHPDQAMGDMAIVQNPAILDVFAPYNDGSLHPTLITASEQRMRSLSLDAGLDSSAPGVRWNGNRLDLNLTNIPEYTVAGLSWSPYQHVNGAWKNLPLQDYWNELGTRHAGDFADEPNEDVVNGALLVIRMYYLALSQGVTRTIAVDGVRQPASDFKYERPMVFKAAFFVGKMGTFMLDRVWEACNRNLSVLAPKFSLEYLGKLGDKLWKATPGGSLIAKLFSSKASAASKIGAGAVIIGAFLLVTAAIAYTIVYMVAKGQKSAGWDAVVKVGDVIIAAGTVALTLGKTLYSIISVAVAHAKTASGILAKLGSFCTSIYSTLNSYSTAIGTSMYANVISFIIQLGIVWGTFFYSWATGAIQLGTIAFGQMLALTIANTVIAIFFFLMSMYVATAIIAAVISSVDAILTVLCNTFNVKNACFTITGKAAEIISRFYFSYAPTVNLNRSTLGAVTDIDYQLDNPDQGYVHGNKVHIRATLHTSLEQDWVDGTDWVRIAYNAGSMITPEKLRQASVKYAINENAPKATAGEMVSKWTVTPNGKLQVTVDKAGIPWDDHLEFTIYKADADYTTGPSTVTLKAGINTKLPADLYISYALPAAECWGRQDLSLCLERSLEGKVEEKFPLGLVLDVFPATLDEFYALDWQGKNGTNFAPQRDYDGDGLTSSAVGGLDRNDKSWDQDGDGIPDGKETELRQQGTGMYYEDPATGYDSDGDGLSDYEEILRGTDPTEADTDRDGLTDLEEIEGWLWAYSADGTLKTVVTSDPTIADTDGDGNNDKLERDIYQFDPVAYPFHPRHVDPLYVTVAAYVDDPDGYVGGGQVLHYTVAVGNTTPPSSPLNFDGKVNIFKTLGEDVSPFVDWDRLLSIIKTELEFGEVKSGESAVVTTDISIGDGWISEPVPINLHSATQADFFRPGSAASLHWQDRGDVTWQADHYSRNTPRQVAITNTVGWDDPYYMVTLESYPYSDLTNLDAHFRHFRLGDDVYQELQHFEHDSGARLGNSQPALICNTATMMDTERTPRCMLVWSQRRVDEPSFDLMARMININAGTYFQPFKIAEDTCHEVQPSVATDGTDFLVSWACGGQIHARAIHSMFGEPVPDYPYADPVRLDDLTAGAEQVDARPTAAWTGDRYTVVWEKETSTSNHDLYAAQITAGGEVMPGTATALAAGSIDERAPQIAYLPDSGGSLVVYKVPGAVEGMLLAGSSLDASSRTRLQIAGMDGASVLHNPKIAYDPRLDGWMITWAAQTATGPVVRWQSVTAGGSLRGGVHEISYKGYSIDGPGISLACSELDCAVLAFSSNSPGTYYFERRTLKPTYDSLGSANLNAPPIPLIVELDQPRLESIDGIPESGFLKANSTFIFGGSASDKTSGVGEVAVRVSPIHAEESERGEYLPAEGYETWVYALEVPPEGRYRLDVLVTDRANNQFESVSREILLADGTPPVVNSDLADGAILRLEQSEEGRFILPLEGKAGDRQIGSWAFNHSGLVVEANVSPGGTGWQAFNFTGDWEPNEALVDWAIDYPLSPYNADGSPKTDPSGVYTVTLRATDEVGNTTAPGDYLTFQVQVDHQGPVAGLENPLPGKTTEVDGAINFSIGDELVTDTITMSGPVSEPGEAQSGIVRQEIRLRPVDVAVWPGMWNAAYSNSGDPAPSLTRRDADDLGGGLAFDWGADSPAAGVTADDFTAVWQRLSAFRASGTYAFTFEKDADSRAVVELDGAPVLSVFPGETTASAEVYATAGLHDLTVRYTDEGGAANLRFGVTLLDSAWETATLAAAGPGVSETTWQYPLPEGVEGLYEIDLRAVDVLGNVSAGNANRWRGEIDTAAPLLEMDITYLGTGASARTVYQVRASDFNLSEEGWISPCPLEPDDHYYYTSQWWQEMSGSAPDQERLYQFYSQCSVAGHQIETPELQACDAYGRCATGSSREFVMSPNHKVAYLTAGEGDLLRLDLNTGSAAHVTDGAGQSVSLKNSNGFVFFPGAAGELLSLKPGASAVETIASELEAGLDYAAGGSSVYWITPDGSELRYIHETGGVVNTKHAAPGLAGLDLDPVMNRIYSVGQQDGLGSITIFDDHTGGVMVLNGADPDDYNSWDADRIAVNSGTQQIFLAGDCGDPAGGSPGTARGRIYGIHSISLPHFSPGVVNGVTGCQPVVRPGEGYEIVEIEVDSYSDKLYYLLRETAGGEHSLWRANLNGSFAEELYTSEQPLHDFVIDESNRPPLTYHTSEYTPSDKTAQALLHSFDYNSDLITFTLIDPPDHGTLPDWPVGPVNQRTYVTYEPSEPDFDGDDYFTYQADDGRGGITTGTVGISVKSMYKEVNVLSPADGTAMRLGEELEIQVAMRADVGISRLEVLDNGEVIANLGFGAEHITEKLHAYTYQPEEPGEHKLTLKLYDSIYPPSDPAETSLTVLVSHEAPTIEIMPTLITLAEQPEWNGFLYFYGTASDSTGGHQVEISVNGEPAIVSTAEPWRGWFIPESPPDNQTFTVTATVTDRLNQSTTTTAEVRVDLVPPAPVTVSLGVQGGDAIEAGQILRLEQPTLTIDWSESADGSGVEGYYAGWTQSPNPPDNLDDLTRYTAAGQHAQEIPTDAVVMYAHLGIRDTLGNLRWYSPGPVTVDAPQTPDLISGEWVGASNDRWFNWLATGGSQMSADYTLYHQNPQYNAVQRFYTTWDENHLALAWEGILGQMQTNDLYIYLDTGVASGAEEALDETAPYTHVRLPAENGRQMEADYLIHIEDYWTARLLRWTGSDWETIAEINDGTHPEFWLDWQGSTNAAGSITNDTVTVSVPFDLLGINDLENTPLDLVALLTENADLEIYAAAPDQNPVNAWYTLSPLAHDDDWQPFNYALTQQFHWDSLALGQVPNAGQFAGSDLRVWITADPAGRAVGFLESDLYEQLTPGEWLDADGDGAPDRALPLSVPPPVVGGQEITYTVHYQNLGQDAAEDVTLALMYNGSLQSGLDTLDLGSIAPGASGQKTFTAVVNTEGNPPSGELRAAISDAAHGVFDWYWVLHTHDTGKPGVSLETPHPVYEAELAPGWHRASGKATDPSGIARVVVKATYPSGAVEEYEVIPQDPMQPSWALQWEAPESELGTVSITARAQDLDGVWSDWTAPVEVLISSTPRGITLDESLRQQLDNEVVRGPVIEFFGTANKTDRVRVCTFGTSGYVCKWVDVVAGTPTGTWSLVIDYLHDDGREATQYEITGVANGTLVGQPITGTFRVDSEPPSINYTCGPHQVSLAEYWTGSEITPDPLVSGTVSDGSGGITGLTGWVKNAAGEIIASELLSVDATGAFSFIPRFDAPGTYTLGLETSDGLGNSVSSNACWVYVQPAEVNLRVEAAGSAAELFNAGPLEFDFIVSNPSTYPATNSRISIWGLPDGAVELTPEEITCQRDEYGTLACALGDIAPGGEKEFSLRMNISVPVSSQLLEVGGLVQPAELDPNYSDNYFDLDIALTSRSDIEVTLVGLPQTAEPGDTIQYEIHVTNHGPSNGPEGYNLRILLNELLSDPDAGYISYVSAAGEGWTCTGPNAYQTCDHAMQGGEFPPISVELDVPTTTRPGLFQSSVASHSYGWDDPDVTNNQPAVEIDVQPHADLWLEMTADNETDQVVPGSLLTYLLKVTNYGPADSNGLQVTNTLPAGVTFHSAGDTGWECQENAGIVECSLPGLLSNQSVVLPIRVTVDAHDTTLTNTATVTDLSAPDPHLSSNTDSLTLPVNASADLSVEMTVSEPVYPGETVTYTLQVTNHGPDAIAALGDGRHVVELEAELPEGTVIDWHQLGGEGWSCGIGTAELPHTIHCGRVGLALGAAPAITVVATIPNTLDELTHTASVSVPPKSTSDLNAENDSMIFKVTPVGRADLVLEKTGPASLKPGEEITYTFKVSNQGEVAAENLVLTDELPDALTYLSFEDPLGSGWACAAAEGQVTCTLASLAAGDQAEITLTAQVGLSAQGTLTNTAQIQADTPEMNAGDNQDSVETSVEGAADLAVELSSTGAAYLGAEFEVAATVANHGPLAAGEATALTFTWDDGADFSAAEGEGWSCSGTGPVTCQRTSPLESGADAPITLTLQAAAVGEITTHAEVSSTWEDPVPSNNSADLPISIQPAVDIQVMKNVRSDICTFEGDDSWCDEVIAGPGGLLFYSIWVYNAGLMDAPNVTLQDTLPAGVTFKQFTDLTDGVSCEHNDGVITCTLANLAEDESAEVNFQATAPQNPGTITNAAAAASDLPDFDVESNTGEAVARVTHLANLAVTQTAPAEVFITQPVTFTVEVSNQGPHAAPVMLTSPLPAGVVFMEAAGAGWTCSPLADGELTCHYPALAAGESASLEVWMQTGNEPGAVTLAAAVSSTDVADREVENNEHQQKVLVRPAANLALAQTASAAEVKPGAALTYTLNVTNTGPSSASGVVITSELPEGTGFFSASSSLGGSACSHAKGVVTCEINRARNALLVDATGSEWQESSSAWRYGEALDNLGVTYTRRDALANPPTAADLGQYPLVIWVLTPYRDAEEQTGMLTAQNEAALAEYLDGGGRLLVVGSSYFDGSEAITPFMRDYLGVAGGEKNIRVDALYGQNAFEGLGPYDLWVDHDPDRLEPTAQAQAAIMAQRRYGGEDAPVGLYTGQTAFFAFRWDDLYENSPAGGTDVMRAVLDHLSPDLPAGQSVRVTIQVTAPRTEGPFTNRAEVTAFTHDSHPENNREDKTVKVKQEEEEPKPQNPFLLYLPIMGRD